jgi:hypothetical protein
VEPFIPDWIPNWNPSIDSSREGHLNNFRGVLFAQHILAKIWWSSLIEPPAPSHLPAPKNLPNFCKPNCFQGHFLTFFSLSFLRSRGKRVRDNIEKTQEDEKLGTLKRFHLRGGRGKAWGCCAHKVWCQLLDRPPLTNYCQNFTSLLYSQLESQHRQQPRRAIKQLSGPRAS